jgi:hypothetical protein
MTTLENPRAIGAGYAYSDTLYGATSLDEAYKERVLLDVDSFSDWIAAECMGSVNEDPHPIPAWQDIDYSIKTNARLLSYALAEGVPKEVTGMAMQELRARWLKVRGVV